jgi:glutamate/tyrosine decarboxylase-like PLP-dependent enzyme
MSTAFFDDAARRARRYREAIGARRVSPAGEAIAALSRFDEPLPEQPCPPEEVLALLDEAGSPATLATTGGRYFGFVTGGSLPAATAANWLAAAWDQNAAMAVMSPVGVALEQIALGWVVDVLGLPPSTTGSLVTGATMANFTCLAAARHAVLEAAGWDVESQGLFGAPPITVVAGAEVHVSLLKALAMLGLGRDRVVLVPADCQGRMRASAVPEITGPAIVCLQAGNVNTGAFDPALEIIGVAKERGAWVHVDGAFGLWTAASPNYRHLMAGYSEADSWATDAHKWPNVPYDAGVALVREAAPLYRAMSSQAAYLSSQEPVREPYHYTPESSRRARGVDLWAALKSLGRSGLADLVDRTCAHARRFAAALNEAGYEVLNEVVINQVLVSFGDPEVTLRVIERIQAEGVCWCGTTVWQGRRAMRISVSSWATTEEDVEISVRAIIAAAGEIKTRRAMK